MWKESCRKLEMNFFIGLNFLASSVCCDNEKKILCFVFKGLFNGDRRLSRKPIAFKAATFFFFLTYISLAQAAIQMGFFYTHTHTLPPCPGVIHAVVFLVRYFWKTALWKIAHFLHQYSEEINLFFSFFKCLPGTFQCTSKQKPTKPKTVLSASRVWWFVVLLSPEET